MTNTNEWSVKLPAEAKSAVIISNISPQTTEDTIRDFFSFCGIIQGFEMKADEHKALVYFEQESAAKTAILLSQAVVDDHPIIVESFYKTGVEEPIADTTVVTQAKSVSHVMAELLASGYVLTEPVVAKGVAFDEKHGVSSRVGGYLNKVKLQLGHQPGARSTGTGKMHSLFNSKAGLKVQEMASKVSSVHAEAKRIAAEKKNPSQALI